MKTWVSGGLALLVTFLSGATTGILIDRQAGPAPAPKTWIDGYVERLESEGVDSPEDRDTAPDGGPPVSDSVNGTSPRIGPDSATRSQRDVPVRNSA